MPSQSSQFSSAIHTHTAFISLERTEIKRKNEKKTSLLKSYAKKNSSIIENQFLPLLSKQFTTTQFYNNGYIFETNKQTNKRANYKIFRRGIDFYDFLGTHAQRKKKFFSSSRISRTISVDDLAVSRPAKVHQR